MSLDKYDRIYWRGVTLNRWTAAALEEWEDRAKTTLNISQGSFRPYTSYSGSSHTGGGAADVWLPGISAETATRIGRDVGFACWWRRPWQGPWPDHIHAVLIGDNTASGSAKWQVEQYKLGFNGLGFGVRDAQTYRPRPIKEFNYKKWEDDVPLTREEINKIADAVWDHKIKNPLTPQDDKMDTDLALNRILNIVREIDKKVK